MKVKESVRIEMINDAEKKAGGERVRAFILMVVLNMLSSIIVTLGMTWFVMGYVIEQAPHIARVWVLVDLLGIMGYNIVLVFMTSVLSLMLYVRFSRAIESRLYWDVDDIENLT